MNYGYVLVRRNGKRELFWNGIGWTEEYTFAQKYKTAWSVLQARITVLEAIRAKGIGTTDTLSIIDIPEQDTSW